jgi:TonB family protein
VRTNGSWAEEKVSRSMPLALGASLALHLLLFSTAYWVSGKEMQAFYLQEISLVEAGSAGQVGGVEGLASGKQLDISEEGATYLNRELSLVRKRIKRLRRLDAASLDELRKQSPLGLAPGDVRDDDITSEFGSGSLHRGGDGAGIKVDMHGRSLLHKVMPKYPDWAEEQGVEGEVVVEVVVLPNGLVKPEMSLVRTSGFKELDHLVLEAVREWSFEELPPGAAAVEQRGRIHFNFGFE